MSTKEAKKFLREFAKGYGLKVKFKACKKGKAKPHRLSENAKKWVEALRVGEYRPSIHQGNPGGLISVGVASEILKEDLGLTALANLNDSEQFSFSEIANLIQPELNKPAPVNPG